MLYKKIDPTTLCLEYACPFCLSAKFGESATLFDHVCQNCPSSRSVLNADELADIPNLQIGETMTMKDYIEEEETYYKNMVRLSQANSLSSMHNCSTDDTLTAILEDLKKAGHPDKNIGVAAWRIMATFFTLDDEAMERYLQIIYGEGDGEDSEDEERKVWPAPPPFNDSAASSSTPCTHDSDP